MTVMEKKVTSKAARANLAGHVRPKAENFLKTGKKKLLSKDFKWVVFEKKKGKNVEILMELAPLLKKLNYAINKSQKARRRYVFDVEVGPGGALKIGSPKVASAHNAEPIPEKASAPESDLDSALSAARKRGKELASEILARDDMLNADAFANRLGTSRATINTKRSRNEILGLQGIKRGYRFPVWQIGDDGKPFPALPALFTKLGGAWTVYRFLAQSHPELDGLSGREALKLGKDKLLLQLAQAVGSGTFS